MRFSKVFPTVDLIAVDIESNQIIVGRKKEQIKYRFPGGFVEPSDRSLEQAAMREFYEEVQGVWLLQDSIMYLGSVLVDDPRYRDSEEKIMTSVFTCLCIQNKPTITGNDDLEEALFNRIGLLTGVNIVEEHMPLLEIYRREMFTQRERMLLKLSEVLNKAR